MNTVKISDRTSFMAARTISPEILHKIIKQTLGPYVAFVPMAKKMFVTRKLQLAKSHKISGWIKRLLPWDKLIILNTAN